MADRSENIRINTYINNAQAQAALVDQEKQYRSLRAEQKKLAIGTQEWIDKQKQINTATDAMKDYRKSVDTSSMSIKQMQTHLQALKGAFVHIPQGTKEMKDMREEITRVQSQIDQAKTGLSGWRKMWAEVGTEAKLMLGGAVAALGIDAVIGKMQGMIKSRAEIADALADISKAAGISTDQAAAVDKQLMAMQTRTSIEDLRAMAVEAGKAGAGTVEEITKAVQQSNIIMVALGDDLGAEAVDQMGKLADIYGRGVLNIGSAVNAAADSSRASAGYQVDFLNRLSGVANTAEVAAESIIGYGVALELNGQKTEAAGTALNDFFIEFVKDTEKFGKQAGFARGELQKLLDEKGTNEAFLQFLEKLKEGSASSKDLLVKLENVGITGTRGAATFLTLANSIATVRSQQDLATKSIQNADSVTNEYNKKNNNFAATIEKLQKKIGLAFSTSGIAKGLEGFIEALDNGLTPAVELASEALSNQKQKVDGLEKSVLPLLARYDELKAKSKLNKDEQIELKKVITDISAIMPGATTKFDDYGNAIEISKDKVIALMVTEKEMLAVRNKDAISANLQEAIKVGQEIEKIQAKLRNKDAEGYLVKEVQIYSAAQDKIRTRIVRLNADEIAENQKKLNDLQAQYRGYINVRRELEGKDKVNFGGTPVSTPGGKTPAQTASEEAAAAAASEATKKELSEKLKAIEAGTKAYEDMVAKIIALRQKQADAMLSKDDQELVSIQDKWQSAIDDTQAAVATLMDAARAGDKSAVGKAQELRQMLEQIYFGLQEEITAKLKEQLAKRNDEEAKAAEKLIDEKLKEGEEIKANRDKVWLELKSDLDRQIAEIVQYYDKEKLLKGLTDEDIAALERKKWEKVAEIRGKAFTDQEKQQRESFIKIVAHYQELGTYTTNLWSAINDNKTQSENQSLNAYLSKVDKEKAKYDAMLKNKQISQKVHDAKIAELEQKASQKSGEIQRKQFSRNQDLAIAQAGISLASGIVAIWSKSFAELGPIAGPILAAIETAALIGTTAVQVDAISSQQPPAYEEGGYFLKEGVTHEHPSGGMPVINPLTGETVATVRVGETILPEDTSDVNSGPISWMLANRGKKYTPNVDLSSFPQFSTATATRNIRYDKGGIFDQATARAYSSSVAGSSSQMQSANLETKVMVHSDPALLAAVTQMIAVMKDGLQLNLYELNKAEGIKQEVKDLNRIN
jgi:TP901 family phage tail tape measure protein